LYQTPDVFTKTPENDINYIRLKLALAEHKNQITELEKEKVRLTGELDRLNKRCKTQKYVFPLYENYFRIDIDAYMQRNY
jgi:hypothetical protein